MLTAKNSLALMSLVAAVPAAVLVVLSVMGLISQAPGLLKAIYGSVGVVAMILVFIPFYILLFSGRQPKPGAEVAADASVPAAAPEAALSESAPMVVDSSDEFDMDADGADVEAADDDLELGDFGEFEDEEET